MDIETKLLSLPMEFKADAEGTVSAVVATFNVIDKDSDVILASAFTDGQQVFMVDGHNWQQGQIGDGVIRVEKERAIFDGRFWTDMIAGSEAYKRAKHSGERQQWSWGFQVKRSEMGELDGKRARFIHETTIHEVSPVLVGAGVDTYTLAIKHGQPFDEQQDAALAAVCHVVERWKSLADLSLKEGRPLSESRRTRMAAIADGLQKACDDLRMMLAETEPMKSADVDALLAAYLRSQARLNGVLVA